MSNRRHFLRVSSTALIAVLSPRIARAANDVSRVARARLTAGSTVAAAYDELAGENVDPGR